MQILPELMTVGKIAENNKQKLYLKLMKNLQRCTQLVQSGKCTYLNYKIH